VCLRVKQRRHRASTDSHPHSEDKIRRLRGAHDFGSVATYFDTIDYGPEASFLQSARYDLLGYDVTTSSFLAMPMKDKTTETVAKSIRLCIGAREKIFVSRSDSANDLTLALEQSTVTCMPVPPYSPNTNIIERMRQTFGGPYGGSFCTKWFFTFLAAHFDSCDGAGLERLQEHS
jgi:hypothetical protein